MLKILRRWWPWLALLAGFAFAILARDTSSSFSQCEAKETHTSAQEQEKRSDGISIPFISSSGIAWRCTGEFIDQNNAAIGAVATIFIAIFTVTLWRATSEQARLTRDSIDIARAEFTATRRAKIFVQTVTVTDKGRRASGRYRMTTPEDVPKPAKGVITIVNGGGSPAFLVEWQSAIYFQSIEAAFDPPLNTATVQLPKPTAPIVSGQPYDIGHEQIHAVDRDWEQFVSEGGRMFFIGRITYEGSDKIRRNTGFCREYDKEIEGRWKPVKESEYEYAY